VRPAAYEVRGIVVARATPTMLLVQHEDIAGLGMRAMELMAITGEADVIDRAGIAPGQRVRLAVRQRNDQLQLMWIEKIP
jgi:hypothetical protein